MRKSAKSEQSESAAVAVAEEMPAAPGPIAVADEMPAAPAPVTPSFQSALTIARQRLANTKADQAEWRAKTTRLYLQLMLRSDNPLPGDGEDLAAIVVDLGITPAQLEADGDLVQRAKMCTDWVSQRNDASANRVALRAERIAMEKRHKEEADAMRRKIDVEEGRAYQANEGQARLNVMARQQPAFFDFPVPGAARLLSPGEESSAIQSPAMRGDPPVSAGDRLLIGNPHPAKLLPSKDDAAEAA